MEKYIGMDVHATSCTAAVVNAQGKRLGTHVLATSGAALVEFLKTQAGTIYLCIEEGTQSEWLVEILSPYVERMVVTMVSESRGQKSDEARWALRKVATPRASARDDRGRFGARPTAAHALCKDGMYECADAVLPACAANVQRGGSCDGDAGPQTCVLCNGQASYELSCSLAANIGWNGPAIKCSQ